MAVMKLTGSKNAILFIQDDGRTYVTSKVSILNLLNGAIKGGFVLLSELPYQNDYSAKFKPSPIFKPDGYIPPKDGQSAINQAERKRNKKAKVYEDIKL